MPLLQVTNQQSQFLLATKTRTTIVGPQISASMTFSASTMEREYALRSAPSETKQLEEKTGATIEFHQIQQSLGMNRPMEYADEAFWNTTLQPDQ
jgi:hypothetical protein